jgi:5-enolpyruvylshikimate-3-phosphate synthase
MALAVAGLATERQVSVQGIEIVTESFPGFAETLHSLGASIQLEG